MRRIDINHVSPLVAGVAAEHYLTEDGENLVCACLAVVLNNTVEYAAHVAQVAAEEAWAEGAKSAYFDPDVRDQVNYPENPHII